MVCCVSRFHEMVEVDRCAEDKFTAVSNSTLSTQGAGEISNPSWEKNAQTDVLRWKDGADFLCTRRPHHRSSRRSTAVPASECRKKC